MANRQERWPGQFDLMQRGWTPRRSPLYYLHQISGGLQARGVADVGRWP